MTQQQAIFKFASICLALLPVLMASCRVTSQSLANVQSSGDPDRLVVIYRAHPVSGSMFSANHSVGASPIVQASADTSGASPFHAICWSKAELRIELPHPDGRKDVARVTLHCLPVDCGHECEPRTLTAGMEERSGMRQARRATFRERWLWDDHAHHEGEVYLELDLKREELDQILADVKDHGFFTDQSHRPTMGVESELEIRVNRRCTSRVWCFEPSLDALTTRVQEQGVQRTVASHSVEAHDSKFWGTLKPASHSR